MNAMENPILLKSNKVCDKSKVIISLEHQKTAKFKLMLVVLVAFFFLPQTSEAQMSRNAFGLRLGGDGTLNGVELSYQKALGLENRLELDFGFGSSRTLNIVTVAMIYQWHWNIVSGLNWYIGPGGILGFYSPKAGNSYTGVGLGGQIGIEYNFSRSGVPILISLDARPMWGLFNESKGFGWGAALGIRYLW